MFYRPTRLFAFKFLGLWAGQNVDSKPDEQNNFHKAIDLQILDETRSHSGVEEPAPSIYDHKFAVETSRRHIVDLLLGKGVPGLTICVSKNGRTVWRAAFGFCDVENQLPCENGAVMRIGSISKSIFVGTVVAPMVEKDSLNLDSSIHQYLTEEEFPKKHYQGKACDITIKQLLTHTSGITHYDDGAPKSSVLKPIGSSGSKKIYQTDDQFYREGFYQRETFRDVIDALKPFKNQPLVSGPGVFHYTTYGYVLLSAVIQKFHQTREESKNEQIQDLWIKILRRNWKMENTYLDEGEVIIPKRARYYLRSGLNGELINAPYADNSVKWAAGGLISTTDDLIKFANTMICCYKSRTSQPIRKETVELLWKRENPFYALGFQRLDSKSNWRDNEELIVLHTGGSVGASSVLMIYPESEIAVAILVNLGFVNLKPLAMTIADSFKNFTETKTLKHNN